MPLFPSITPPAKPVPQEVPFAWKQWTWKDQTPSHIESNPVPRVSMGSLISRPQLNIVSPVALSLGSDKPRSAPKKSQQPLASEEHLSEGVEYHSHGDLGLFASNLAT
ncbi:uncharacterized protein B0H18DRAFT_962511 [Fomitopsis serialis]|uniref:uncharacterized protein n=1 Tax=Fomitopsis serialis TaxID=139415 RepID=UPI002008852A|nr:uncharacterized protein B0H18DRAFT_962511 [Neoantrodia serialis]KAH9911136.1 hypothetical protein B0H18DRAFT_962511 [Neoantrodia serialis]